MTLDDLYDISEGRLRRYAMNLVEDPDQADDLVQETFIRAMPHLELLGQLNPYQRQAWLYRVLKRLFLDAARVRRREQTLMEHLTRERPSVYDPWTERMSSDVFEQLPQRDRELLEKRYVLDMTSEEIGRELGIPAATVRSRLHLAMKRLRARPSRFL